MECKHPYYKMVEGILACVQCGEPSPKQVIEDKTLKTHETKQIWPPESKREKVTVKKQKRR